jgi:hypothetical protein
MQMQSGLHIIKLVGRACVAAIPIIKHVEGKRRALGLEAR